MNYEWRTPSFLTALCTVLCVAGLIFWGTGDYMRAVTALIAFCPYAFVQAKPMTMSAAVGFLAACGIRIRRSGALERLSHMENIAFTTDAIAPAGCMQTDVPELISKLRHMGMHPVLLAPIDMDEAAQIAAQADIRDIRTALPPSNDPFALSTVLVQRASDNRSAAEEGCLHIALGSVTTECDADILCVGDDLGRLPVLLRTAYRLRWKIEQNTIFGYTLNFIALGLAAAGILSPVTGAVWHVVCAVLILLNAASLRSIDPYEKKFAFSKAV